MDHLDFGAIAAILAGRLAGGFPAGGLLVGAFTAGAFGVGESGVEGVRASGVGEGDVGGGGVGGVGSPAGGDKSCLLLASGNDEHDNCEKMSGYQSCRHIELPNERTLFAMKSQKRWIQASSTP
jgi:hypothetical protein